MRRNAIIMLNWNGMTDTVQALDSLVGAGVNDDLYIVDNASDGNQQDELAERIHDIFIHRMIVDVCADEFKTAVDKTNLSTKQRIFFIRSNVNMGFAKANNFVAETIAGYYEAITLLNNDVEVPNNVFDKMFKALMSHDCAALTCDIRYYSDKNALWNAGGKFTWYGDRRYFSQKKIDKAKEKGVTFIYAEFITGCCLMLRSSYIAERGLFTNKFFHGEEDFNLCMRIKKTGEKCGVALNCTIYHKVGRSMAYSSGDIKNLNKQVVHYSNRIIDMKEFYGSLRWKLWRRMYIALIYVRAVLRGEKRKETLYVVDKVKKFSLGNQVDSKTFKEIMSLHD